MPVRLTREEYETAERLKAAGIGWPEIAERMGDRRAVESLRNAVYNIRAGKWGFQREDNRYITEVMVQLVLGGFTIREVAILFDLSPQCVGSRLRMAGCDAEVRREYRRLPC